MTDFGRGIKSGLIAGLIEGVITSMIYALAFDFIFQDALNNPPEGLTMEQYRQLLYIGSIGGAPISGLIFGLILGVIFALLYDHIPTEKGITKGTIMGLILWIIQTVLNIAISFSYITIGLNFFLSVIIFGPLLGFFWDRFG